MVYIIHFNGNAIKARDINYADNNNLFDFIKIGGDKVYYNDNQLIGSNIQPDTWYRIDFAFNIKKGNGTIYFTDKFGGQSEIAK